MAKTILVEGHAFVFKSFYHKTEAIEVFGDDLSSLRGMSAVDLVDVREETEEGSVESHTMSDFLSEIVMGE